jgi:hypothetical protein
MNTPMNLQGVRTTDTASTEGRLIDSRLKLRKTKRKLIKKHLNTM